MKRFFDKIFARKNQKEGKKEGTPSIEPSESNSDIYSADNAIRDPDLDEFNRREFSERIARTIAARKESKSLVVGIYGKWGEGKTTVLNFIDGELKKHTNVVPLNFNPWLFPSETELLIAFYSELAMVLGKSLSTRKEDAGKFIKEYVGALAGFFDKKEAVEKIAGFLSDVRLEELRDRIGNFLKGENKLVVVLMDDIDRLDKSEIHSIFRLIKLSANLENVVYVLAFDRDVVEDALSERYGSNHENPGQNFLEKIVQVPVNLPKVPKTDLRNFCYKQINKALQSSGIEVTENDSHEFTRGFITGIEIKLETPRMAIRYANMLNFSLPLVKDEVNVVEFLLIEAIRAFFPDAYEVIKNNRDAFTAISLGGMPSYPNERERIKKVVERAFVGLEADEKNNLQKLINMLFPRQQDTIYDSEWNKVWAEEKRIASDKYFDRYFTYSVPLGDVSDVMVENFINSLANITQEELTNFLNVELSSQNAETFISKLHQKIGKIHSVGQGKLAISISSFGDKLPNPKDLFSFHTPFSRAALLVSSLVEAQASNERKYELAIDVVNVSKPITFAYEVIKWLGTNKRDTPSIMLLPDDLEKVRHALANRIENLFTQDALVFEKYPDRVSSLFSFWRKFGSHENSDKYLESFLNSDLENVHKLLISIVPIAFPGDGSAPRKMDLERNQYDFLQSFADPNMIYELLKKAYGEGLDSEEYPYDYDKPLSIRFAKQFAWIHKKVLSEKQGPKDMMASQNNT